MWVVYTEIHTEKGVERWYYGKYNNRDRANEVALELKSSYPIFHRVCPFGQVEELKIKNI